MGFAWSGFANPILSTSIRTRLRRRGTTWSSKSDIAFDRQNLVADPGGVGTAEYFCPLSAPEAFLVPRIAVLRGSERCSHSSSEFSPHPYSILSACIGLEDAARQAGIIVAIAAAAKSNKTLPPIANGSMTGVR